MAAKLLLAQAGLPLGSINVSRSDGLGTGALVTCSHTGQGATKVTFTLLWAPEDDFTAAVTFTQNGNSATFTPDSSSIGGTYRIKLEVQDASGTSEQIRLFAIRTATYGIRIPALNELSDETASLLNRGTETIAASEFNEPANGGPFKNGNYGGWYSALTELYRVVEQLL